MSTDQPVSTNPDAEPPADWHPVQEAAQAGTAVATQEAPAQAPATQAPASELSALDQAIATYSLDKLGVAGTFSHAFRLAQGMAEIDRLITSEMMATIMPLMNTRLGFKTDKDPTRYNKRLNDGKGGYDKPYAIETVKKCLIEATLRGAYPVNNEFNIIASGPYLTKEFYQRKVKEFPGVRDLQEMYGVPKMINGALCVEAVATWKLNGAPQRLERLGENAIAIIADSYSNADQSQGKAARKLLFAVYRRLTGSESSTDMDPNDPDVIDGTMRQQALAQDVDDVQRHPVDDGRQESPADDFSQAPVQPRREGPGSEVDEWAVLESRYVASMTRGDAAGHTVRFKKDHPNMGQADTARLKLMHEFHQKRIGANEGKK